MLASWVPMPAPAGGSTPSCALPNAKPTRPYRLMRGRFSQRWPSSPATHATASTSGQAKSAAAAGRKSVIGALALRSEADQLIADLGQLGLEAPCVDRAHPQ